MHQAVKELNELKIKVEDTLAEAYLSLQEYMDDIRSGNMEVEDLSDIGLFCRQIKDMCDELRKEAKAREMFIGQQLARRITKLAMSGEIDSMSIKGNYSSCSPKIKKLLFPPKVDSPAYKEMCDFLGIPDDHPFRERGIVDFHCKALSTWATEEYEKGSPAPDWATRMHTDYTTVFRQRNNVIQESK
jgi:hypothetical protein